MEYFKQNASGLYLDIQKIGCFFRAACHLAEVKADKALTINQLNKLWEISKMFKYIDDKNNVTTSAPIANLAAKELGLNGKFTEVAIFQDGSMFYYPSIPHEERASQFYIQKIKQNGPSITHFRNVDKYGQLTWDPHTPDIKVMGIYYTICYRYDEVKNVGRK